jgi:GDPmannose 4,6-dehydratase
MRALITGVTGQDGGFLASHLMNLGYEVCGLIRQSSTSDSVDRLKKRTSPHIRLIMGDVSDYASIVAAISQYKPDEIYNLAAQSHVAVSFVNPVYTSVVNGTGVLNVLEAARTVGNGCKVYQASTSELFGSTPPPQHETTIMHPRSPYGVAKLHGYWSVVNARESYGTYAANGILFNHESEYRGYEFVTRKITRAAARIKLGVDERLRLGNLDAMRDWGYAGDYVKAMQLILSHATPTDFVVATGKMYSVREFLEKAFAEIDYPIESNGGHGIHECYISKKTGETVVCVDEKFYRPAEVNCLCGDASKIMNLLGWKPETTFDSMVSLMVKNDYDIERKQC